MKTIRQQSYTLQLLWIFIISLGLTLSGCQWGSGTPASDTKIQAITKIKAYAQSNGTSDAPDTDDYADAEVTGITAANLADMNQVVENLIETEVDSTPKLQALADALGGGSQIDTIPPVFTSPESVSVPENQTAAITLVATDSSGVTYSISDANASSFDINSTTGDVTFKNPPDFESGDILYTFTATATDGSAAHNSAEQNVTIYVTDVSEGSLSALDGNWTSQHNQSVSIDVVQKTWATVAQNGSSSQTDQIISNTLDNGYIIYLNNFNGRYGKRYIENLTANDFYFCDYIYDAQSEEEAIQFIADPNQFNLDLTTGCGSFPWEKLTRMP